VPPRNFRPSRRRFLYAAAAVLAVRRAHVRAAQAGAGRLTTVDLGGATLIRGAGGNVVAVPGPEGALLVDGGLQVNAAAVLAAVRNATKTNRIHTLINTHWHPEQTGSNEAVGRAGGTILAHEKTTLLLSNTVYSAVGIAARVPPQPQPARPTQSVRIDGTMDFAGRQVAYGYMPAAHTDGDIYVHFPAMNLLAAGGVVSAEEWPLLDYKNGAWLGGRVRALEKLAGVVRADTQVVPSVGRVMTGAEIVRQRDMYQKLFSTMIGYLNMGLGPEDMAERKPLKEFEAQYGDSTRFASDALRSMMIAYVPD
jgi:glyoxylase-like metal-dependent hydrolase (beta-lactamase superfamily II)